MHGSAGSALPRADDVDSAVAVAAVPPWTVALISTAADTEVVLAAVAAVAVTLSVIPAATEAAIATDRKSSSSSSGTDDNGSGGSGTTKIVGDRCRRCIVVVQLRATTIKPALPVRVYRRQSTR